jgi:hypothetical protein
MKPRQRRLRIGTMEEIAVIGGTWVLANAYTLVYTTDEVQDYGYDQSRRA